MRREDAIRNLANEVAIDALLDLIDELTVPSACDYDHDGMCQTHFLDERPCPHERAQKLLAARGARVDEGEPQ